MAADKGPTAWERFRNGIFSENPVLRQVIAICSALAITTNVKAALTMVGAVAIVLIGSNIVTSLVRHRLRQHVRILVFTLIIAGFVTIVDRLLAAFLYDMSKELGAYIPLIIANCLLVARCEICAMKQGLLPAAADAAGQTLGYGLAICAVASIREILGNGTWFGLTVLKVRETLPTGQTVGFWDPWVIMLLAPGAFLALGALLALSNVIGAYCAKRASA